MLQGEIKRDFQHQYLVFPLLQECKDYQVQMLVHQKIEGLLTCMIRRVDGRQLFSYDISGKKTMEQVFESRGMCTEDFINLFKTLEQVLEGMKDYLLDMDMLLLLPQYIFYEELSGNWFFSCFPREDVNVYSHIHELSKYFLTVLNHKEETTVQLGYGLYRETMSNNFCFHQIVRQLQEEILQESAKERKESTEIVYVEEEERKLEEKTKKKVEERKENVLPQIIEKKKGAFFFGSGENERQRRRILVRKAKKKEKQDKEKLYGRIGPMLSYAGEKAFSYGNVECMLIRTANPKKSLSIQEVPYLIGSLEYAVDGYIDSAEVSHFHARIEKEGEEYYITDLSSEKGTFLNAQQLLARVSNKLTDGDCISFGAEKFSFQRKHGIR